MAVKMIENSRLKKGILNIFFLDSSGIIINPERDVN